MQHTSLRFEPGTGWGGPIPAHLDSEQTLVLVFGGPKTAEPDSPQGLALQALAAQFPRSVLVGCSSAGEIQDACVRDDSVSVAVARFAKTRLRKVATRLQSAADSRDAGTRLAADLVGEGLRAVLLFSEGLTVNGSALVAGLSSALPPDVSVSGGLAGDGARFARTWVVDGGHVLSEHVVAVGLYGKALRLGHGCVGGWSDFGPERRITHAEGNVLYALDDQPALDLYKHYLGDRAAGLPGTALLFPLAVRRQPDAEPLVRTVLAIDEEARSMTFAGDIPQGGVARLMRSTSERLIDSAARAADAAFTACGPVQGDALALTVSCVGRRLVLGERTEEEVEMVRERGPACAHVGFYSYGEISPALEGGVADLHNQTMTITVLAET